MLRYLSTGSSVIAALMAADERPSAIALRPDLLEFLLVRTLAAHEARVVGKPEPVRKLAAPDQYAGSAG